MLKLARASLHVTRHLSPRERATIGVALELLARAPGSAELAELRAMFEDADTLLSDDDMRALAYELTRARKVKVCRTKQKES